MKFFLSPLGTRQVLPCLTNHRYMSARWKIFFFSRPSSTRRDLCLRAFVHRLFQTKRVDLCCAHGLPPRPPPAVLFSGGLYILLRVCYCRNASVCLVCASALLLCTRVLISISRQALPRCAMYQSSTPSLPLLFCRFPPNFVSCFSRVRVSLFFPYFIFTTQSSLDPADQPTLKQIS